MTSNALSVLNASAHAPDGHSHTPSASQPAAAALPSPKDHLTNGDHHDDEPNESEAETVVLDGNDGKEVIKTERVEDDDAPRLRCIREESRVPTPQPQSNGRRRSSDVKFNSAKQCSDREGKSPVPTSPSSRTTSRHTKDTSPSDSPKSLVHTTLSPVQQITRGRSASTVDSRKRKIREDSCPKIAEPPRQKAKTEVPKDLRLSNSPALLGFGRHHKRSQSTQSIITGVAGRKRREIAALALSEHKHWSDSSSDNSSSPQNAQTPNPIHTRLKRSSHRAMTSPARSMAPTRKTDRFGATRLARESEKGDLDAVKAAFEEAPDSKDQVDFAGIAPLQKAALHGWTDVVEFLIRIGCRTDCESNDRDTPLIDAVENGHLDVVRLLLNQGRVNPHHQNKKGQRAIDVLDYEDADAEEMEKELKEAMRREIDTSSHNDQELSAPKEAKSAPRLLYNEYNVETLIEKAGDGDIIAVGELINSNIRPNITCGVAAARGGHYDILSILLASGLKADPDPSKHPETPMTVAIGRGHLKIIQLILEQDHFNPTRRNKEGKTYYEISEERRGPKWEQEREMLKRACDEHMLTHKSPRRSRKEAPNTSAVRTKRKSPPRRERSDSPRSDTRHASLVKSNTQPSAPQKSRRLLSGKEMANREGKRRKRVVDDDESSEDESEEDVRPPTRKVKPRSYSEGEETEPVETALKVRSDDNDSTRRTVRARPHSDESDEDYVTKPSPKTRTKPKPSSAKPTPEIDSPDERKPVKNKIKYKTMEDKIRKRRLSDASADDVSRKRTPSASAKSTPAPPERTATPEATRERHLEDKRLEVEVRRKAAEAEAQKREEEEVTRKAAEEERRRQQAEADAEAKRQADDVRRREEEQAQQRAEDEVKRQKELLARQDRLSKLPLALRRACERGTKRPLHFSGEQLGVSVIFLPLIYANAHDLRDPNALPNKTYLCSFQVVGILGLPELDLAHLPSPYSDWNRLPVTKEQRITILRQCDDALLAQDARFPVEGALDYDYGKIKTAIQEARAQFMAMEGLYWIEESVLGPEVEKIKSLEPLLDEIQRRRVHFVNFDKDVTAKKESRPKKNIMDLFGGIKVNGEG